MRSLHLNSGVHECRPSGPRLMGALVGNKSDFRDGSVESRAEVVREDARRLAVELGLAFFETSAVTAPSYYLLQSDNKFAHQASNIGVEEPFKYLANQFYQR